VEDRGRESGVSARLGEHLVHVLRAAATGGGDDGGRDAVADGPRQGNVVALLGPVGVDGVDEQLASAPLLGLSGPLDHVEVGALAAALHGTLEPAGLAIDFDVVFALLVEPAAGVHRDDDTLVSEGLRARLDEVGVRNRPGVDGDLVRSRAQRLSDVLFRPDSAADRQRDEDLVGDVLHDSEHGLAALRARGDVEEDELVGPGLVVPAGHLHRVSGVFEVLEIDARVDRGVAVVVHVHVDARDDALGESHSLRGGWRERGFTVSTAAGPERSNSPQNI